MRQRKDGSVMMRTSCLNAVGGYRSRFSYAQDRDLWLRLLKIGEITTLPQVLYLYRINAGQARMSSTFEKQCYALYAQDCALHRESGLEERTFEAFRASINLREIKRRAFWSNVRDWIALGDIDRASDVLENMASQGLLTPLAWMLRAALKGPEARLCIVAVRLLWQVKGAIAGSPLGVLASELKHLPHYMRSYICLCLRK